MKKFIVALSRVLDWVSLGSFYFGAFLLFVMTMSIGYEVTVRYFFLRPTVWALDFSEYILVYSTFLAAPWILKNNGHTSITLLIDILSEKVRNIFLFCSSLVGALVCAVITYSGAIDTWQAASRGTMIVRPVVVPKFIILWIIPFGFFLVFWYFVRLLIGYCKSPKSKA
jgi:C4-dicarboxylate transporter DctQ subunit